MDKIKQIFGNRWVKFSLATIAYLLLCVVWTGNLWMLFGLPFIYDYFISRLFYRYVWRYNEVLCERSAIYKMLKKRYFFGFGAYG